MNRNLIKTNLEIYTLFLESVAKLVEAYLKAENSGLPEKAEFFKRILVQTLEFSEVDLTAFDAIIQRDFESLMADDELQPLVIKYGRSKINLKTAEEATEIFTVLSASLIAN